MADLIVGDIILIAQRGIGAHIIRWATNSHWSHGYMYRGSPYGKEEYIEAGFKGVGVTLRKHYPGNTDGWVVIRGANVDRTREALKRSTELIGKEYDWVNYPRLFLKALWRRIFKVKKSPIPLRANDRFYCFELLGYAFQEPWVFGTDIILASRTPAYIRLEGPDIP